MKSETYNALAGLNRGCELMLESLAILKEQGIITADYVQEQTEMAEELRAGINSRILNKQEAKELEDWYHFGKMRETTERRDKGEQTIEGLPD